MPAPGERPDGPDRQAREVQLDDPYDLGAEFFRWEFATAVAGAILEINPFDQPNVQEAKDRTGQICSTGRGLSRIEPEGSVDELLAQARAGRLRRRSRRSSTRPRRSALRPFVERIRSADRLRRHVRARPAVPALDRPAAQGRRADRLLPPGRRRRGDELAIPGQKFGFGRLIQAQAAGDYAALKERGRPVARVRLEEIA